MNTASRRNSDTRSFSSTLLDAIYRSIDEDEGFSRPATRTEFRTIRDPDLHLRSTATTGEQTVTSATAADITRGYSRCNIHTPKKRLLNLASALPESSFGGFWSPDGESVVVPVGRKSDGLPALSAASGRNVPKEGSSFSGRFRRTKSCCGSGASTVAKKAKIKAPSSPGGRLSRILSTLCSTVGQQKKTRHSASTSPAVDGTPPPPEIETGAREHQPCRSRSWTRRNPSIHGRRYVDFNSVGGNVNGNGEVGEPTSGASPPTNGEIGVRQRRPRRSTSCPITNPSLQDQGEMSSSRDDKRFVKFYSTVGNLRRGQWEAGAGNVPPMSTETATDLCGETAKRGFGLEEVEKDSFDADLSDTSSDLFELEGLTTNGGGRGNGDLSVCDTIPT